MAWCGAPPSQVWQTIANYCKLLHLFVAPATPPGLWIGDSVTLLSVALFSTLSKSGLGRAIDNCSSAMPDAVAGAGPRHGCHLYGSANRGASAPTAKTPFSSRGARPSNVSPSPSPCPCGTAVCLVGASSSGACGSRRSGGGPSFQSANVGGDRSRRCGKKDGPLDGKNPAWVALGDPGQGTFTFESIHRIVAESVATWERDDRQDGMRRDASIGAQRRVESALPDEAGCRSLVVTSGRGDDNSGGTAGVVALSGLETTPSRSPAAVVDGGSSRASQPPLPGPLTRMAADRSWTAVFQSLFERGLNTFVSGGPGVGKTSFLRALAIFMRSRLTGTGAVVVVAPTGSAAKTANGVTYHSLFGFMKDYKLQSDDPAQEAARLLALDRWRPIVRRLSKVEVPLINEILMVPADNLDVMHKLLQQSRRGKPAAVIYTFGDVLQLRPPFGKMAIAGHCWPSLFGAGFAELTRVHRQGQPDFIAAIHDARFGRCTDAVQSLMDERSVTDEAYKALQYKVLHIMSRNEDVDSHNDACLRRLCADAPPTVSFAIHNVKEDPSGDRNVDPPYIGSVTPPSSIVWLPDGWSIVVGHASC